MLDFLKSEGVSPRIISRIEDFRAKYPTPDSLAARVPVPRYLYYGKDVWEEAITALLCGENLLLVGPKATGKNVLAENLAAPAGTCITSPIQSARSFKTRSAVFKGMSPEGRRARL